ncbi:coiled-coil domain-containing protein [Thermovibrio ammonificans]|jgi:predicted RNase H-like nuclease (RuvC/YqgF family)|uniref:Uncharacterized protein n=1 Tax=Thermovibrio ammonificans (strain DSM 15698 / JCM 12110 / HB-1) TaxID=648996 RepID=E8T2F0_THEA1|nr:hypothetical protein [Thermovibrio ammonificans]ADU97045.1 hypothetical protein Theam_1078 [Thermovibrio ammonificans HB-1]
MEKGFRDIEEYFLRVEAEQRQRQSQQVQRKERRFQSRDSLVRQIKNLNEKLKGKDRKIKELYQEIGELRSQLQQLKKREEEFRKREQELKDIDRYRAKIEDLQIEISRLKGEVAQKERQIENLKAQEVPKPKVELFIEVALNALTELVEGKGGKLKVLFSKRFRKDMVKEVSVKPFLFDSFVSALSRIESTSRLLRRDSKHDIYRLRVTSPYGEYRAIYLKMEGETVKFVRFGQRDSIYQELDACGWKFE